MSSAALLKKLLVKPGHALLVLNAPDGYLAALDPLPDGVALRTKGRGRADVVQLFARDQKDLAAHAPAAFAAVGDGGVLWIAYPKRSAKVTTDLTRDVGWDAVEGAGWTGVALVAIDEVWSALRFRPRTSGHADVGSPKDTGRLLEADEGGKVTFEATLFRPEGTATATFLRVPDAVMKVFATRARVPVAGTLQGFAFRSSFVPMGGGHMLAVNEELRQGAGVKAGDTVRVVVARDTAPRVVEVPEDLAKALAKNKKAKEFFAKLAYTHQREYVEWITSAKKAETREARVAKALGMLGDGVKTQKG
jgi:hypothetical protein